MNTVVETYQALRCIPFTVKVFKAIDDFDLCLKFAAGHKKVLEDFGVKNVTSSNHSWMDDPDTYCIVYMDEMGAMVGGIRVEMATEEHRMPISSAISKYDDKILTFIDAHKAGGIGEVCGMWTDRRVAGLGVGHGLVRFAVYTITNTFMGKGICLVTEFTKVIVEKFGFIVANEFGLNGTFEYPDARYIATVMVLHDPQKVSDFIKPEQAIFQNIMNGSRYSTDMFEAHYLTLKLDLCFDL